MPSPPQQSRIELTQVDVARLVACLRVVVRVVDANDRGHKASVTERIAVHTTRITELQQKIKDVEHKALVHQMQARLAQIRLQQMELTQLIQYANKLMDIRKREQELLMLTSSLNARIHSLREKMETAERDSGGSGGTTEG